MGQHASIWQFSSVTHTFQNIRKRSNVPCSCVLMTPQWNSTKTFSYKGIDLFRFNDTAACKRKRKKNGEACYCDIVGINKEQISSLTVYLCSYDLYFNMLIELPTISISQQLPNWTIFILVVLIVWIYWYFPILPIVSLYWQSAVSRIYYIKLIGLAWL